MALTITVVDSTVEGNKRVVTADVTFDSAYVTGGEPVDLGALGMNSVLYATGGSKAGVLIQYDHVNKKLLAYVSSTAAQVANAFDLSATSIRMRFIGQ